MQKEILKSLKDVGNGPFGQGRIVLKEEDKKNEYEHPLKEARESHLVVAALIATGTFAAAFTLPGGYKNEQGPNQGTAILAKKAAFIVFVISDAISMVLSISAIFIHFWMALVQGVGQFTEELTIKLFRLATLLTMIAMGTMVIAFITGTYAVLAPSLGLAITTCLIGLSFFFIPYLVYKIIDEYLYIEEIL